MTSPVVEGNEDPGASNFVSNPNSNPSVTLPVSRMGSTAGQRESEYGFLPSSLKKSGKGTYERPNQVQKRTGLDTHVL